MASIRQDLTTGKRLYVQTRYGEPVVDRLKALGAHWDAEQRCWWISARKRPQVEAILVESDQRVESGTEPETKPEDPHSIRLSGKGEYKGRTYYLGARTRDGQQVRCLTLPDTDGKFLSFWAPVAEVTVTKHYTPREVWDGRRYSGRTRTEYTTLGSIADFIRRQKDPATARGQCTECGSWGPVGEPCRDCGGEGSHV